MHPTLLPFAETVGNRMAEAYIEKGDYFPKQAWGCEGQIYPSLTGIALLRLFECTENQYYLDGVREIIASNSKKQMSSGGWPLALARTANGIRFDVSERIVRITSNIEDLPPTVTAIRLISEYQQLTGDSSFQYSLDSGYEFLMKYWDEERGGFREMLEGEALKLRASPRDYHIYAFQCMDSVQHIHGEASEFVLPLYQSVKKNFEAMNADTYPLLYGMHAGLISQVEGPSEYVISEVRERIAEQIGLKSKFVIPSMPGALGHRDGVRGIRLDEAHLRNSIGAALAMSYYDFHVGVSEFTTSETYAELSEWIQSMYDNGRYYEFIDLNSQEKRGEGSSGQYLPIFWILGRF